MHTEPSEGISEEWSRRVCKRPADDSQQSARRQPFRCPLADIRRNLSQTHLARTHEEQDHECESAASY